MRLRLGSLLDDIAIQRELTNQGIDLAQRQRRGSFMFEIAADERILVNLDGERGRAGIVDRCHTVFPGQRKNALDAAHRHLPLLLIHRLREPADRRAGVSRPVEQLLRGQRRLLRAVFGKDAMRAARLTPVFP